MAFNLEQNSPTSAVSFDDSSEDYFYGIIDRLKIQKALPRDSFTRDMPFFNLASLSKESQVKELFQDVSDPNIYKSLIKNIISLPEEKSPELLSKRLSAMQVLGFAQIILYKVLPCPEENCPNKPREVATHNQYKDYEYECPFYHHDKDRRRLVLTPNIEEEFTYKANYSEDKKNFGEKSKCARNYFESMFHPLYYKMFRCKREYCNFSQCCPFYHSEDEKKSWDCVFSNFIRKDRISYVKDKQKYYEQGGSRTINTQQDHRFLRAGDSNVTTPTTPQMMSNNFRKRPQNVHRTPQYQPRNNNGLKTMGDWVGGKEAKAQSATKLFYRGIGKRSNAGGKRKSSEDETHLSPVSLSKRFNEAVGETVTSGLC